MSTKSLNGKNGPGQKDGKKRPKAKPAPTPLEFALSVMRDETQSPAVRASMAKLAAALSPQSEAPAKEKDAPDQKPEEQWSDLELARRMAHVLFLADMEQEEKDKAAQEKATQEKARPRSSGRDETQERMQSAAPAPVTNIAPHEPAPGFIRFASQQPPQVSSDQVLSDQALPDEEPRFDPLDPHPGYRWIR